MRALAQSTRRRTARADAQHEPCPPIPLKVGSGAACAHSLADLGWFEVINVGKSRRRFCAGPSEGVSASGFWGAFTYFAGAVSFQFACIATLVAPTSDNHFVVWLEWVPQVVGGLCFTIAACIELRHNHAATWRHRVFWLCVFYLAGSFLFFLAVRLAPPRLCIACHEPTRLFDALRCVRAAGIHWARTCRHPNRVTRSPAHVGCGLCLLDR